MVKCPLRRSISTACALFFLVLSLILSVATYLLYTSSMYARYEKELTSVESFVEAQIDHDDMAECARTGVESEKYRTFQSFLDNFIDQFQDVHYIYLMKVLEPNDPVQIRVICTANSTWEKENVPQDVLHLGDGEPGWYDQHVVDQFREILTEEKTVFFRNESTWGIDYTLAKPMYTSSGECYGLLCVDLLLTDLNEEVYRSISLHISLIFLSAVVFIILMLLWMRKNVTSPLLTLEKSVTDFAKNSDGKTNPEELVFQPPDIKVNNEVRSLSNAMTKLAEDMRGYVTRILTTEQENEGLQNQVFVDALTKVRSNTAYREKTVELQSAIDGGNAEFGLVMVDINRLKQINDQFGHEFGDKYIIETVGIVCEAFSHSPVYRIGGDEFVVVLTGEDYRNRDMLFEQLLERFSHQSDDELYEQPWQQYSAAVGMSVYRQGDQYSSVFDRADHAMYKNKLRMKEKMNVEEDPSEL